MSDSQAAAPSAQPASISIAEAAGRLAEQRDAEPAGDAMGGDPDGGDVPEGAVTSDSAEPEAPDDGLIDLGDGLRVSLDQVREGFMLKADHTRKTQALAEERRAIETIRAQKVMALEQALGQLQQQAAPSKSLQALLAEDPVNGLARFAQQVDRMQQLSAARELARGQRNEHLAAAKAERDRHLAQHYWTSAAEAEKGIAEAVGYAKSYGYGDEFLAAALNDPHAVAILDKARKFDELQAGKARIERLVADKPKVVRPGAKVSAQAAHHGAAQSARSKLKSSGSLSDAVAYLQAQRKTKGA
ncbi:MAG: hypothetical protein IT566_00055 [Rhodospirillaceae bacterium]|nr:hypothetical protein [Rhodospirillaceae bacterium]